MKPNALKLIVFAVYLLFFSASSSAQKTYSDTDIEKMKARVSELVLKNQKLSQAMVDKIFSFAEQDAMRMVFVLEQSRLEAERKIIEATGERDAQIILAEGLSPEIIKIRSIEALEKFSTSINSKLIITDGKAPFLIQPDDK